MSTRRRYTLFCTDVRETSAPFVIGLRSETGREANTRTRFDIRGGHEYFFDIHPRGIGCLVIPATSPEAAVAVMVDGTLGRPPWYTGRCIAAFLWVVVFVVLNQLYFYANVLFYRSVIIPVIMLVPVAVLMPHLTVAVVRGLDAATAVLLLSSAAIGSALLVALFFVDAWCPLLDHVTTAPTSVTSSLSPSSLPPTAEQVNHYAVANSCFLFISGVWRRWLLIMVLFTSYTAAAFEFYEHYVNSEFVTLRVVLFAMSAVWCFSRHLTRIVMIIRGKATGGMGLTLPRGFECLHLSIDRDRHANAEDDGAGSSVPTTAPPLSSISDRFQGDHEGGEAAGSASRHITQGYVVVAAFPIVRIDGDSNRSSRPLSTVASQADVVERKSSSSLHHKLLQGTAVSSSSSPSTSCREAKDRTGGGDHDARKAVDSTNDRRLDSETTRGVQQEDNASSESGEDQLHDNVPPSSFSQKDDLQPARPDVVTESDLRLFVGSLPEATHSREVPILSYSRSCQAADAKSSPVRLLQQSALSRTLATRNIGLKRDTIVLSSFLAVASIAAVSVLRFSILKLDPFSSTIATAALKGIVSFTVLLISATIIRRAVVYPTLMEVSVVNVRRVLLRLALVAYPVFPLWTVSIGSVDMWEAAFGSVPLYAVIVLGAVEAMFGGAWSVIPMHARRCTVSQAANSVRWGRRALSVIVLLYGTLLMSGAAFPTNEVDWVRGLRLLPFRFYNAGLRFDNAALRLTSGVAVGLALCVISVSTLVLPGHVVHAS